jgi:hypothetical protein
VAEQRVQDFAGPWWVSCDPYPLKRGQLVRAFVPHVDLMPNTLVPEGRKEPQEHGRAIFKLAPLRIGARRSTPPLPVAALPQYEGEVYSVHRAKVRYGLVVSDGGPEVAKDLRPQSSPRWQSAPTFLVAPYYGTERTEGRAGWYPPFLSRIRQCEYPQFMLDTLPGFKTESVLRFDHIQPVGKHHESYEPYPIG